jgi:hypothetical protein
VRWGKWITLGAGKKNKMEFKVTITRFGFITYSVIVAFFLSFLTALFINLYYSGFNENNFIIGMIGIAVPFLLTIGYLIIVWYKHKQILMLTEDGIQTKTLGNILWKEIKECSYEFFKGVSYIYIKLKNNKRYTIHSATDKFISSEDSIAELYQAIKERRYKSPEHGLFTPKEHHIHHIKLTLLFILVLIGMAALIIFSFY